MTWKGVGPNIAFRKVARREKKRDGEQVYKPDSVPPRQAGGRRSFLWAWDCSQALATYPRVTPRPLPNEVAERAAPPLLFGLAPCGVFPAPDVAIRAVRSYIKSRRAGPHLFTLTSLARGGIFSVALSVPTQPLPALVREARPILAVSQHTALRSPDFPPPGLAGERSPNLLAVQLSV